MQSEVSTADAHRDRGRTVEEAERELAEAREQQTATSEILRVISGSPTDIRPVFDTIARSAARLCEGFDVIVLRVDGDFLRLVAHHGPMPAGDIALHRGTVGGRTVIERRPIHVEDLQTEVDEFPEGSALARERGHRTTLSVPLLKGDVAIGNIQVRRNEVRPFSDQQSSLLKTFADQAVIAIENTRLFEEVQARNRELIETGEILRVISSSPTNTQPVFDTIVRSAVNLCDGVFSAVALFDGELLHLAAHLNYTPEGARLAQQMYPRRPDRQQMLGRAVLECAPVQVEDALADPEYAQDLARAGTWRSLLGVPMLRDGRPIGAICVMRGQPGPFSSTQIKLLETFASQAVIAIENTRLFEAEQASKRELIESLDYQMAISNVLGVISRSQFDLQPVLQSVVETAARLCRAENAIVYRLEDGACRFAAGHGHDPRVMAEVRATPHSIGPGTVVGRAIAAKETVQIEDVLADPLYEVKGLATRGKTRSVIGVPLMREGDPIGAIALGRSTVEPFEKREIGLVTTFADQAVIAIENARLFEEVQTRTRELQESLEYQTAISGVLSVISLSPTDVEPVFKAILRSAVKLCDAVYGTAIRYDGEVMHLAAGYNHTPEVRQAIERSLPRRPDRLLMSGRAILERAVVQVEDAWTDPDYSQQVARAGRFRSMLAVPLLRAGEPVGALVVNRGRPGSFSRSQIALLEAFADQAVIAIENVRLFEEVQARTRELSRSVEELRALGQIGQTVSSTLDLSKVLQTVVEQACAMSYASGGAIYVFDKARGEFHLEAGHNMSAEHIARVRAQPIRLGDPVVGECASRREAVQVEDLRVVPATPLLDILTRAGVRAILSVPLLHQGEVIGALAVRRNQPGEFSADIVHLLEAFAAQSAIAVHNARLFKDVEDASRALAVASQHKSQFVANMSHELRTPLAAMLGYAELLKEGIYGTLPEKSTPIIERIRSNGRHLLGLINTVLDISKIESGQFSLNFGEYALDGMIEAVRSATESLAEGKKLAFTTEVPKGLPFGLGDEQRLTQVLLNLVGNAIKFTDAGEVKVTAGAANGCFAVTVSDTGPGIPPEEREKIFEKFHQIDNSSTRTQGGTGLGLAIAKEIVVMHGGRIWVESIVGRGSTFRMELPVRAAAAGGIT